MGDVGTAYGKIERQCEGREHRQGADIDPEDRLWLGSLAPRTAYGY